MPLWIQETLIVIMQSTVPILALFVITFISQKISELKLKNKNDHINKILDTVDQTVAKVVAFVAQTFVDHLKYAGEWDEAAEKEAFQKAKQQVLLLLTEEARTLIVSVYGNLDAWLLTVIEAQVQANKLKIIVPVIPAPSPMKIEAQSVKIVEASKTTVDLAD